MANTELLRLHQALIKANYQISQSELENALAIFNVHRSLEAVVGCLRTLFELIERHGLGDLFVTLIGDDFGLLQSISQFKSAPEYFLECKGLDDGIQPFRPHTGDSPCMDILQVYSQMPERSEEFELVALWFIYLFLKFRQKYPVDLSYSDYLSSEEKRYADLGPYFALVNAAQKIRQLSQEEGALERIRFALNDLSEGRGQDLAHALHFVKHRRLSVLQLSDQWCLTDTSNRIVTKKLAGINQVLPAELKRLIRLVWPKDKNNDNGRRKDKSASKAKVGSKSLATVNELFVEEVELEGTSTLLVSDGIPPVAETDDVAENSCHWSDGDEHEHHELTAMVLVGDGENLHQNSVSAKGKRDAIQRQNVSPRYNNDYLSVTAVRYLTGLVSDFTQEQELGVKRAKLAIILCLLTGRDLDQVVSLAVVDEADFDNAPSWLMYCPSSKTLWIRAVTPVVTNIPDFCSPYKKVLHSHNPYLAIAVPDQWHQYFSEAILAGFGRPEQGASTSKKSVLAEVRALLSDSPESFSITTRGIANVLRKQLALVSHEDIALVKVITDTKGGDVQSVLHYASFKADDVASVWSQALAKVWENHPIKIRVSAPDTECWLGSFHAIDTKKLAVQLRALLERIKQFTPANWLNSDDKRNYIRYYNLVTLYTLLWCQLACVSRGRKTVAPVGLCSGWALISDKHHQNGGMERLLPLTEQFQQQLTIYYSFVNNLAVTIPSLRKQVEGWRDGVVQFRFINENGTVLPYRPKYLSSIEILDALPANWARKVVQSNHPHLEGWYVNVAMGHWSTGRHPWSKMSSFVPNDFRGKFLQQQSAYESSFGFEPLDIPGLKALPQIPASYYEIKPPEKRLVKLSEGQEKELTLALEQCLSKVSELVGDKFRVRDQVVEHLLPFADDKVMLHEFGSRVCLKIRARHNIPIFWERMDSASQEDWVLSYQSFLDLCWFDQYILPSVESNLSALPAVPRTAQMACEEVNWADVDLLVEIGRLIAVLALRQGLLSWHAMQSFLKAFRRGGVSFNGVVLVELGVDIKPQPAGPKRTVSITPYVLAYLQVLNTECPALIKLLMNQPARKFFDKAKSGLKAYLESVSGMHVMSTSNFLDMLLQRLMLEAGPMLASYASGSIATHDMSVSSVACIEGISSRGELELEDEKQRPWNEMNRDWKGFEPVGAAHAFDGFLQAEITSKPMANKHLNAVKPDTAEEQLIVGYAKWLLKYVLSTSRLAIRGQVEALKQSIEVAIWALAVSSLKKTKIIDHDWIDDMVGDFKRAFPENQVDKALYELRHYFSTDSAKRLLANFSIKADVPMHAKSSVRTRVLSEEQRKLILNEIEFKVRGNDRASYMFLGLAFQLGVSIGARRGELLQLRGVDVLGDLFRIQEYDGASIKTSNGIRNVPIEILPKEIKSIFKAKKIVGHQAALAHDEDFVLPNPDHAFDQLNKWIQKATGDESLSMHVLRHTFASSFVLSLLVPPSDRELLIGEMPWTKGLLRYDDVLKQLTFGAGNQGQGLYLLACLIGHGHPATTLRHYVHTLAVALYSHLRNREQVDLFNAFKRRSASSQTMRKRIGKASDLDQGERNRYVSETLNDAYQRVSPNWVIYASKLSSVGPTDEYLAALELYKNLLTFAEAYAHGKPLKRAAFDVAAIAERLQEVGNIKSGKIGSLTARHSLTTNGSRLFPECNRPQLIEAAVIQFICWFESLRKKALSDLGWVLESWLHHVKSSSGRMLITEGDEERLAGLCANTDIKLIRPKSNEARSKGKVYVQLYASNDGVDDIRSKAALSWLVPWYYAILPQLNQLDAKPVIGEEQMDLFV